MSAPGLLMETTLGGLRRSKSAMSLPGTPVAYWLPCMSCACLFLTSSGSGHIKCFSCRGQTCACGECDEWRTSRRDLVARGLMIVEVSP